MESRFKRLWEWPKSFLNRDSFLFQTQETLWKSITYYIDDWRISNCAHLWTYIQWLCFQEQFTKRPKLSHKGERYQEFLKPFLLLWQNLNIKKNVQMWNFFAVLIPSGSAYLLPLLNEVQMAKYFSYQMWNKKTLSNWYFCPFKFCHNTIRNHFCLAIIAMDWANMKYKRANDKHDFVSRLFILGSSCYIVYLIIKWYW